MAVIDFLPKGLSPYVSPEAGQIAGNAVGVALYGAAKAALTKYFVLQPVGTETADKLRDRIALQFVQQFGDKWEGPITADAVNAFGPFTTIVAFVSPLSRRMTTAEFLVAQRKAMLVVGGAILVGGLVLFLMTRKNKGK
jgi:hypothetical protein